MTVLSMVVEGTMVVSGQHWSLTHWSHRPLSSLLLLPHSESVRVHALLTSAASVLRSAVGTGLAGPLTVLAPLHQHLLLHQPPHLASLVITIVHGFCVIASAEMPNVAISTLFMLRKSPC